MQRSLLGLITVVFLLSGLNLGAEPNTETYKDIIYKAQGLSLQKERGHATQLLISSIERESKKGPPPKELIQALEEISSIFLSDKAQQLYELAISLRLSDPSASLQKQNEAARLEPDNLQISLEQFRLQLMMGNCNDGASIAEKLFVQMPQIESVRLAAVQAALCRGRIQDATKIRAGFDLKKSNLTEFWGLVDVEIQYNLGNKSKATDLLVSLEKQDKAMPEISYWYWKVAKMTKPGKDSNKISDKNLDAYAEKYISACKSLSPRAARSYINEAFLCRRVSEVESSLKKNNNAQQ